MLAVRNLATWIFEFSWVPEEVAWSLAIWGKKPSLKISFSHALKNHFKNANHHSPTQSLTSPESLVQTKNVDELLNTNKQKNPSVPHTNSQHSPSHLLNFKTKPVVHHMQSGKQWRGGRSGGRYGDGSPGIISGFALTAVKKESAFPFLHHYPYNCHPFKIPY